MSNKEIKTLTKMKVEDIQKLSDSELKEIERIVNERIKELEEEKERIESRTQKMFLGVLFGGTTALITASMIMYKKAGMEITKDVIEGSYLFGATTALTGACLCAAISNSPRKIKYKKLTSKKQKIEEALSRKRALGKAEIKRTMIKDELISFSKALTEGTQLNKEQENFKKIAIEDLLENGADPEIVNLPVIQGIFDYELTRPVNFMEIAQLIEK